MALKKNLDIFQILFAEKFHFVQSRNVINRMDVGILIRHRNMTKEATQQLHFTIVRQFTFSKVGLVATGGGGLRG